MQRYVLASSSIHPCLVLAILMGTLGLGLLAAALFDGGDAEWSAVRVAAPTRQEGERRASTQPAPALDAAIGSPSCQPQQGMCAPPDPQATGESRGHQGKGKNIQTGPGEREIFLFGSAAVARKRVWVQDYVEAPPSADLQMIASTSPYP